MPATSLAGRPSPPGVAVEYGGFRFPLGTRTQEFRITPVQDEARRTITHSEWDITVEAFLNGGTGSNCQAIVQGAIALLNEPGQSLFYRGRGVGDFIVNVGGAKDCLWGPFPRVTSFEWHGDRTAKITWGVRLHLPTCVDARYDGPMEFNYKTSATQDRHGLTQRVYSGFIKIANNRVAPKNRRVIRSADEWRGKIYPPLLSGFARTSREFNLSADKCRLDFSIRDEELPGENVPPPNIILAEAEHSYTTAQPGRLFEFVGSLSATYEGQKGNPVSVPTAVAAYKALAEDRIGQLLAAANAGNGGGGFIGRVARNFAGAAGGGGGDAFAAFLTGAAFGGLVVGAVAAAASVGAAASAASATNNAPCIIPISFTLSDPTIYDHKRVRLEMRYKVAGASLLQILNLGGLWRPAPSPNSAAWLASISAAVSAGGIAGLPLFFPGEEDIVDLCGRIPADRAEPGEIDTEQRSEPRRPFDHDIRGGYKSIDLFRVPSREKSWMSYFISTRVETDSGVVVGKTLPDSALYADGVVPVWDAAKGLPTGAARSVAPADSHTRTSQSGGGETFVHRRVKPTVYVYLTGYATRAGYEIPGAPELTALGGLPLVACNRPGREFISNGIIGNGGLDGSIPIFGAKWVQRYAVVGDRAPTTQMPTMPNPVVS